MYHLKSPIIISSHPSWEDLYGHCSWNYPTKHPWPLVLWKTEVETNKKLIDKYMHMSTYILSTRSKREIWSGKRLIFLSIKKQENSTYNIHEYLHKADMVHDNHGGIPRSFQPQPQGLWPNSPWEGPQILVLVQYFIVVIAGDPQRLTCLGDPHELLQCSNSKLYNHGLVTFSRKRDWPQ